MKPDGSIPIIIRETAVALVGKILVLEFIFMVFNLAAHLSNDAYEYFIGKEYLTYVFTETIIFAITMILRLIIIIIIFFNWFRNYWVINEDKIVHHQGIFFKKKSQYPTKNIESVDVEQGIFGRLFNFGTIELSMPILNKTVDIISIPYPNIIADALIRYGARAPSERIIFRDKP